MTSDDKPPVIQGVLSFERRKGKASLNCQQVNADASKVLSLGEESGKLSERDLSEIIRITIAWPKLARVIKQAILALVSSSPP